MSTLLPMPSATDITARRFTSKKAAFTALREAGGVNYADPTTHQGIGSGKMRTLRNVFQMPTGEVYGVYKRGGRIVVDDETAYRAYWAGSISASTAAKVRNGEVRTFIAG